jgi:hypothetical protein
MSFRDNVLAVITAMLAVALIICAPDLTTFVGHHAGVTVAIAGASPIIENNYLAAATYFRKWQLAARYGVTLRTVERMVADGRLPPPDLYLGKFPLWGDKSIIANEKRAAAERRPKLTAEAAADA